MILDLGWLKEKRKRGAGRGGTEIAIVPGPQTFFSGSVGLAPLIRWLRRRAHWWGAIVASSYVRRGLPTKEEPQWPASVTAICTTALLLSLEPISLAGSWRAAVRKMTEMQSDKRAHPSKVAVPSRLCERKVRTTCDSGIIQRVLYRTAPEGQQSGGAVPKQCQKPTVRLSVTRINPSGRMLRVGLNHPSQKLFGCPRPVSKFSVRHATCRRRKGNLRWDMLCMLSWQSVPRWRRRVCHCRH